MKQNTIQIYEKDTGFHNIRLPSHPKARKRILHHMGVTREHRKLPYDKAIKDNKGKFSSGYMQAWETHQLYGPGVLENTIGFLRSQAKEGTLVIEARRRGEIAYLKDFHTFGNKKNQLRKAK